jgi:glycosyltransferase involved in cell wall biosynthesis
MPLNTSKNSKTFPKVSIIIPTLNSEAVINNCLASIKKQDYRNFEIIIIDNGSIDKTIKIAAKYTKNIFHNPIKSAEASKAFGIKKANGAYIALIDSDNILPSSNWLTIMLKPLETNINSVGSEPWEYTYRPQSGIIERYSALTGVNDPYTLVANNYDRKSFLNKNWNGLNIPTKNFPNYQEATLYPNKLMPTIGANGTILRSSILKKYFKGDYLFDIDLLQIIQNKTKKPIIFTKVKVGIIHTFCESSISKFIKKQNRRSTDLYIYKNIRDYSLTKSNTLPTIKFILYVVLIFPMIYDVVRGFIKKPDFAWLLHPILCLITLYIYVLNTIKFKLNILKPINRLSWQQ